MRFGEARAVPRRQPRGATLVVVLLLLALTSLGLSVVGPAWADQARRERERDLLRIGALYARALASYRAASPGSDKHHPERLEQLLADTRFVGTMRHLRKLYPDPLRPGAPWGLVKDAAGRIVGVYSHSDDEPVARGVQQLDGVTLPAASRYSDWKFMAKESP